jgi:hypothetical protein
MLIRHYKWLCSATALAAVSIAGCGAQPPDGEIKEVRERLPGGLHGTTIRSASAYSLALNAYGGARSGAPILLNSGCAFDNADCTWTYSEGMLLSDRAPNLAIHPGANNWLELTDGCTPTTPGCTWTLKRGVFVNDTFGQGMNALGGAHDLGIVALHPDCTADTSNKDCKWIIPQVSISTQSDPLLTAGPQACPPAPQPCIVRPKELADTYACAPNIHDCGVKIENGFITPLSGLVWFSQGNLKQVDMGVTCAADDPHCTPGICPSSNPRCTWTFTHGAIVSDEDPSFMLNSYGGASDQAPLKINTKCKLSNINCLFQLTIGAL